MLKSLIGPLALLSLPFAAAAVGRAARQEQTRPKGETIPDPDQVNQKPGKPAAKQPWRSPALNAAVLKLRTSEWWSRMGVGNALTMFDAMTSVQNSPRIRNPVWVEFPLLSYAETKLAVDGVIAAFEAGFAAMEDEEDEQGAFKLLTKPANIIARSGMLLVWMRAATEVDEDFVPSQAPLGGLSRLGRAMFNLYQARSTLKRTKLTAPNILGSFWRSMVYAALVMDEVGAPIGGKAPSTAEKVADSLQVGVTEATHTLGDVGWGFGSVMSSVVGSVGWGVLSSPLGIVVAGGALWWLYER